MSYGYLLVGHAFLWSSDLKFIFYLHEAFIRVFDSFLFEHLHPDSRW
jgi:hypothetical protein